MPQNKNLLRLRPFTHSPGMLLPIPYTSKGVKAFPTLLQIEPDGTLIPLPIQGPVKEFTVMLELEMGAIKIFGKAQSGYFAFWLYDQNGQIKLSENAPLSKNICYERLALGVFKKADWQQVLRRNLLPEVLPFWFLLGQMIPDFRMQNEDSLFFDLEYACGQKNTLQTLDLMESIWKTGFNGILYPQNIDSHFWGYAKNPLPKGAEPFSLLSEGYSLLKSFLANSQNHEIEIAPFITKLFTFGSAVNLKVVSGKMDFVWSKHKLFKVNLKTSVSGNYLLKFPKPLTTCRLVSNKKSTSLRLSPNVMLDMEQDREYFLDRFT